MKASRKRLAYCRFSDLSPFPDRGPWTPATGRPERAFRLFARFYIVEQELYDPFAVDGLEGLPRGFPSERFEGSVDHGFVGFPDPRVGDEIDRFPLRKVESELAVHVLDRALLVGDVGVRVEDLGPDLPDGVGLDPREVGEAGVVVGEDEGEDPFEGLPADPGIDPIPKGLDRLGVVLRQEPDVDEVELGYRDRQDRLPVGDDRSEEVHLASEFAGVPPPMGEVVEVAAAFLSLGSSAVFVGLRLPFLVLGCHRKVDLLRGGDALRYPAVDRLLGRDPGDGGVPRDLVDGFLPGEAGGEGVVDEPELGFVAVEALPALDEALVCHGLRGLGDVAELRASASGPAVLPRAAVADEGEAGEPPAFAGAVGLLRPVPPYFFGDGGGVQADPLGDGLEGFAVREAVGDFHPLLEGEVFPMW